MDKTSHPGLSVKESKRPEKERIWFIMPQPCGRFAPSPSGRMHLGNVLCALLSWLSARAKGGKYVLRIEDLDAERCPRSYADLIEDDLRWLGLDWDEGGSDGGDSWYQSHRTEIYEKYYALLQQKAEIYPCFCSRAALHAASAPHLSDGRVLYAGTCCRLSPAEIAEKRKQRSPAARIHVPDETVTFLDGVQGECAEHLPSECGDFILRRSDGVFAYQLAVTVDDGLMGVTEVVRGRDLLDSTARQIWLLRLMGFPPPEYYHIPLLLDCDGKRLSKRDEDLDLGLLRQRFTPEQVVGALAFSSHLTRRPEPVSPRDLIPLFRWDKIPKTDLFLPEIFRSL